MSTMAIMGAGSGLGAAVAAAVRQVRQGFRHFADELDS